MNNSIDAHQLKAFQALCRTKNFTKAASEIGLSQSAFSQRIKNLETELGTTLIIRSKSGVLLTETGEKVLRHALKMEALNKDLFNSIKSSDEHLGQVRIAGFSSIFRSILLPSLSKLMKENEKLNLKAYCLELRDLFPLLRSTEVDYIISNKDYSGELIESVFLGYEDNVLVESTKHKKVSHYLDHDENDATTSAYFKVIGKVDFNPPKRYVDDGYALVDGVRLGMGKAIVPSHLIQGAKDLKVINPKKILKVPVYLSFYKQPFYERLHHELVSEIKKTFAHVLRG